MALASDQCLCLHKVEYSETSQVLTLFGRGHGIVKVLAKGAHRRTKAGASRFDGGIDLLDLGTAIFTDDAKSELATLTEWKLVNGHLELRRTLRGLHLALYSAELVSTLIEARDPHARLFDRLVQTLPEMATERVEEAMLAWVLDLLRHSGYLPELFNCVSCQKTPHDRERTYFSPARGGLICQNCEGAIPDRLNLDRRLLRLVQSILQLPRSNGVAQRLPRLTRLQTDPLNRLLAEHITHTLGKKLRTWRYLELDELIGR
jgi:DNA repair protein RecO (recombination protein O)